MDIINWILKNGDKVQVCFSTFLDGLEIEMRLYNTPLRSKRVLDKRDLETMGEHMDEVLDIMLDEVLRYYISI